jgi:cofilin
MNLSENIALHFGDLRMKRAHRFLIMKVVNEGTLIEVEHVGERDSDFASFKEKMPKDEPRYAVYDIEYKTEDGRQESKIVFIFYSPDNCSNSKDRFVYASGKEACRTKINPVNKEFQINDHEDLNEASWISDM